MEIVPSSMSYNLKREAKIDDFPDPDLPDITTLSPLFT